MARPPAVEGGAAGRAGGSRKDAGREERNVGSMAALATDGKTQPVSYDCLGQEACYFVCVIVCKVDGNPAVYTHAYQLVST